MNATLPSAGDLSVEQRISSTIREMTAASTTMMHACEFDAMALKATALAIATGSFITAGILGMWQPTLGITILVLFPSLRKWLRCRRLKVLREKTAVLRAKPDFSNAKCDELVANLSWHPISLAEKRVFFTNSSVREQRPHVYT
jgi:hypothetical protein